MKFDKEFPQMMLGEAQPKRPCYFVIQWAHAQRWAWKKHTDVRQACNEAYGMSATNMKAWNLGPSVVAARKIAKAIPAPSEEPVS